MGGTRETISNGDMISHCSIAGSFDRMPFRLEQHCSDVQQMQRLGFDAEPLCHRAWILTLTGFLVGLADTPSPVHGRSTGVLSSSQGKAQEKAISGTCKQAYFSSQGYGHDCILRRSSTSLKRQEPKSEESKCG